MAPSRKNHLSNRQAVLNINVETTINLYVLNMQLREKYCGAGFFFVGAAATNVGHTAFDMKETKLRGITKI